MTNDSKAAHKNSIYVVWTNDVNKTKPDVMYVALDMNSLCLNKYIMNNRINIYDNRVLNSDNKTRYMYHIINSVMTTKIWSKP